MTPPFGDCQNFRGGARLTGSLSVLKESQYGRGHHFENRVQNNAASEASRIFWFIPHL